MGHRLYTDVLTLNPPPGLDVGGDVNIYAVGEDPNGVLTATVGDFAFEVGTANIWSCDGGSVWTQVTGSGAQGGTRRTFTFRPGGTADAATGVYTTWATAHAAAAAAAATGEEVVIVIDDTTTTPAPTTAGTFDMTNISLRGNPLGGDAGSLAETALQTVTGTFFTNWSGSVDDLAILHAGAGALYTVPTQNPSMLTLGNNVSLISSGGPIFDVTAESGDFLLWAKGVVVFGGGGADFLAVAVGKTASIISTSTITLASGAVSGAGDVSVSTPASISNVSTTQAGLSGSFSVTRPTAANIQYTPGTGADWADPDPTLSSQAIDRLAAAVAGLLGAPIPV